MPADLCGSGPIAAQVLRRAVVHLVVLKHAMAQPSPSSVAVIIQRQGSDAGQAIDQRKAEDKDYLVETGLWVEMIGPEREFMTVPMTQVTLSQLKNALAMGESLGCLLWALGRVESIPPYDRHCDPHVLLQILPERPVEALAKEARLREFSELEKARSAAERWHWRSRAREIAERGYFETDEVRQEGSLPVADIIRASAEAAFNGGEAPAPLRGDFPAFGKPYCDLTPSEWTQAKSIAVERHRALNWVCGMAPDNRWEQTPTDT